ncbi:glutamate-5-semialdehyde dehydrogenase [Prochlorococcus sp. MIT 1223]|uniref:glutamate-5-semialdehyde dehydrogenase n=1 Tax=Prochlorococcus sp. MIT 1223 TaxID=3096217 RepID=UPI002A749EF9|nr:glutamate-5-semialdehyde dehydrogenase [Prochlorococcus sp. MIT 1223]
MKNLSTIPEPSNDLYQRVLEVRKSSKELCLASDDKRKQALFSMAEALNSRADEIVDANIIDLRKAEDEGINKSLLARLKLDHSKLLVAVEGVRKVAGLQDPIGLSQLNRELDSDLILERCTVPLGVLGVIFEARPDAVIQIASLAIRSGNGAILKGGSEATLTNTAIIKTLQEGLSKTSVKSNALCLLTSREESMAMLRLDGLIDLIIPRGSNELVRFIQDNTSIPVLGHADGICHLYIDSHCDIPQGVRIALDSKTQYSAACNSIETLLLHESIAEQFLKQAIPEFSERGVLLKGDKVSNSFGVATLAEKSDWSTEYLDLILSIKVVSGLEEALEHIDQYGSRHTDAIVTNNLQIAEKFMMSVNSAGVYHNCSTRFADGFRYGFGAEVGISTQTLPPRGPVGLEGLVTYKYFLRGNGHIAADFVSGKKSFIHKDLSL